LGSVYSDGLERAARAIPPAGRYVLVDRDPSATAIMLQGDLAPRRALLVQDLGGLRRRWRPREPRRSLPLVAVVYTGPADPLRVIRTADLLAAEPPP
jgi:hypothetical protein